MSTYLNSIPAAPDYRPTVGDWVLFPSGSAAGGCRRGRVVSVGTARATIAYYFDRDRCHAKKLGLKLAELPPRTKAVPFTKIRPAHRPALEG